MIDQIETLKENALAKIIEAHTLDQIQQVRQAYLGKKGEITSYLKSLKGVKPEDRRALGKRSNEIKLELTQALERRHKDLIDAASVLPEGFDATHAQS